MIDRLNSKIATQELKIYTQGNSSLSIINTQNGIKIHTHTYDSNLNFYNYAHRDLFSSNPALTSSSSINSEDKFTKLMKELKELLTCPITTELMKNPMLTPSGNTVEDKSMIRLIIDGKTDPFTRQGVCKELKSNYLVKQILEVIKKH